MSRKTNSPIRLSIVVPLFNEVHTIEELHRRLSSVLYLIGLPAEILYVDDGSVDGTVEALEAIEVRTVRRLRHCERLALDPRGWSLDPSTAVEDCELDDGKAIRRAPA